MKYKLVKRQDNPDTHMRLIDVETDTILGAILRWEEYGRYWYRTTVTMNGVVHGRDTSSIKESIAFILEKRDLLTDEIIAFLKEKK